MNREAITERIGYEYDKSAQSRCSKCHYSKKLTDVIDGQFAVYCDYLCMEYKKRACAPDKHCVFWKKKEEIKKYKLHLKKNY